MANEYDGEVQLGVKLKPKDIQASAKQLSNTISEVFKANAGKELNSTLKAVQVRIDKTNTKSQALNKTIDELASKRVTSDAFNELENSMKKVEKEAEIVETKLSKISTVDSQGNVIAKEGAGQGDVDKLVAEQDKLSDSYHKLLYDQNALVESGKHLQFTNEKDAKYYENAVNKLQEYNNQQAVNIARWNELARKQGDAVTSAEAVKQAQLEAAQAVQQTASVAQKTGQSYEEYKQRSDNVWKNTANLIKQTTADAANAIRNIPNAVRSIPAAVAGGFESLKDKLSSTKDSATNVSNELENVQKSAKRVSNSTKSAAKNVKTLGNNMKSASKSASGFDINLNKIFKKILMYGFGIRSVYVLVRRLKQAIMDGLNEMAKMNDGNNQMNKSLSMLTSSFSAFKNSIAAAVAPLVTKLAPAISHIIDLFTEAMNKVAGFVALLTGASTYMKALKIQKDYAEGLDKTAKNTKKAEKAAKGYLSPLDEINKYQSKEKEDEDSGSQAPFAEVPVDSKMLDWLDKLKKMLQPIIDKIKELKDKFIEGFKYGMGSNWDERVARLKEGAKQIRDALIDIFTDPNVLKAMDEWSNSFAFMLGSLAGSMASIGLTLATNLVAGMGDYLTKNKERIKNYLIDMFNIGTEVNYLMATLFADIADIFSVFADENGIQLTSNLIGIFTDAFMGITQIAARYGRDILTCLVKPIDDNKEKIKKAFDDILRFLASITGSIKDLVDETVDKYIEMYDNHVKPLFDSLAQGISDLLGQALEAWNTYLKPVLDELAVKFDEVCKQYLQPLINEVIGLIGDWMDVLKILWETWLKPLLSWLIDKFGPIISILWKTLGNGLMTWWKILGTVFTAITQTLRTVLQFIKDVFEVGWKQAWENMKVKFVNIWNEMKEKMKSPLNSILSSVERLVNGIISGINSLIDKLNDFTFGPTPDWLDYIHEGWGNREFGLSISHLGRVQLPRLAQGAVIPPNKEFMAMLGDQKQGMNIETPLETMKQAFREALSENGGGGVKTIQFILPNKQVIAEYVIEGGRILQSSRGSNPFELA